MKERIRNLSERGEFFLVTGISFAYFILTSLTFLLARALPSRFHARNTLTTYAFLGGIATEVLILVVVAAILRLLGWTLDRLGLRFSWKAALAGIPLFVGCYVSYVVFYWTIVGLFGPRMKATPFGLGANLSLFALATFIIVNSFFEETLVTGYIFEALSSRGRLFAGTISLVIRLAYHLYQGPIVVISVLPFGLLFAWVYARYRTLWPLLVAHTLINALSFVSIMARPH